MKKKFGGTKPVGTPSLGWSSAVVIVSLLAGASVVHNIFKPDLVHLLPLLALLDHRGVLNLFDEMTH